MDGVQYNVSTGEIFCFAGDLPKRPAKGFNCQIYKQCYCPPLEADGDIAGAGVIAAFVSSAVITTMATLLCLIIQRPSCDPDGNELPSYNPIDRVLRRSVCRPMRSWMIRKGLSPDVWEGCAYEVVMALSDQQLVTGLAILITAIIKLAKGTVTVYHFNMATDLAWFSGNVHLLSLLVIRQHNIESVKPGSAGRRRRSESAHRRSESAHRRSERFTRWLRILLMIALAVLLLYVYYVSAYQGWYGEVRCPVLCTVGMPKGGSPLHWMWVNFALILYNYPLNIFLMWRTGSIWWVDKVRPLIFDTPKRPQQVQVQEARLLQNADQPDPVPVSSSASSRSIDSLRSEKAATTDAANEARHPIKPSKAGFLGALGRFQRRFFLAVWYMIASELWHIVELLCWFGFGVFWLVQDRGFGQSEMEEAQREKEQEVGFGQLIPLILLVLPFMQLIEAYTRLSDRNYDEQRERDAEHIPLG
ncbi:hypothetical protein PpBr36_03211 [Pyricularia pennisetigena]|uniref:hypothetical protein n=1 Tax=Pyricularia pennisetigena TaxID=1578925 RepID=UPI00115455EA|nr:hypothetical protein PpBr36_03211 [Pyricularia pennisetigena]TLS30353.1 hypothetical protein PpBr36_03211 [Pyricularia pennisetigena]